MRITVLGAAPVAGPEGCAGFCAKVMAHAKKSAVSRCMPAEWQNPSARIVRSCGDSLALLAGCQRQLPTRQLRAFVVGVKAVRRERYRQISVAPLPAREGFRDCVAWHRIVGCMGCLNERA